VTEKKHEWLKREMDCKEEYQELAEMLDSAPCYRFESMFRFVFSLRVPPDSALPGSTDQLNSDPIRIHSIHKKCNSLTTILGNLGETSFS
jgi:hypothetical protein